MGCMSSSGQSGTKDAKDQQGDQKAIENFLTDDQNLDKLWSHFDKNGDGTIDEKEFDQLVYNSLLHFCMKRNPDLPPPSKDNMDPFIRKLVKQLQPFVDQDQDMKITKDEFKGYGTYLTTEFKKLSAELNAGKDKKANS